MARSRGGGSSIGVRSSVSAGSVSAGSVSAGSVSAGSPREPLPWRPHDAQQQVQMEPFPSLAAGWGRRMAVCTPCAGACSIKNGQHWQGTTTNSSNDHAGQASTPATCTCPCSTGSSCYSYSYSYSYNRYNLHSMAPPRHSQAEQLVAPAGQRRAGRRLVQAAAVLQPYVRLRQRGVLALAQHDDTRAALPACRRPIAAVARLVPAGRGAADGPQLAHAGTCAHVCARE